MFLLMFVLPRRATSVCREYILESGPSILSGSTFLSIRKLVEAKSISEERKLAASLTLSLLPLTNFLWVEGGGNGNPPPPK
jgi:hypothetical protein